MPTLIISGPAQAFAKNPRASKPITDRKTLTRFHGLVSEEACADIFDESRLTKLKLSGGRLRFVFDDKTSSLRIVTAYHVPRQLTELETQLVVDATKEQWSDGCGSGSFDNFHGTVLSTALAMALLNSGHSKDDIGDYFVDAFPSAEDEETRVEFVKVDAEKTDSDYLQEAAAWGEPQAQYQFARQLEEGDGVKKNKPLAFENYQRAAAQGHSLALTFLGLCFERGTGTTKDLKRGVECFEKAAKQGLPLAMHCLGECYFEGRGVAANPVEGIKWYRRGSELGDVGCTAQLGDCYEYGNGVPVDLQQALELYERCIENGFDAVEPALKRVNKQLKKK
ncbi:MAG: sel1 repeat family protein [Planctomycetes bacterium]|nr:sel1 repeat family protein [Planctomycetota bacterium]